jgi:hypothetical protein
MCRVPVYSNGTGPDTDAHLAIVFAALVVKSKKLPTDRLRRNFASGYDGGPVGWGPGVSFLDSRDGCAAQEACGSAWMRCQAVVIVSAHGGEDLTLSGSLPAEFLTGGDQQSGRGRLMWLHGAECFRCRELADRQESRRQRHGSERTGNQHGCGGYGHQRE